MQLRGDFRQVDLLDIAGQGRSLLGIPATAVPGGDAEAIKKVAALAKNFDQNFGLLIELALKMTTGFTPSSFLRPSRIPVGLSPSSCCWGNGRRGGLRFDHARVGSLLFARRRLVDQRGCQCRSCDNRYFWRTGRSKRRIVGSRCRRYFHGGVGWWFDLVFPSAISAFGILRWPISWAECNSCIRRYGSSIEYLDETPFKVNVWRIQWEHH